MSKPCRTSSAVLVHGFLQDILPGSGPVQGFLSEDEPNFSSPTYQDSV